MRLGRVVDRRVKMKPLSVPTRSLARRKVLLVQVRRYPHPGLTRPRLRYVLDR